MSYTTQMDAARQGIITPEMKAVAASEHIAEDELRELIALGQVIKAIYEDFFSVWGGKTGR